MGEVYRARDTRLERMVAIKVLPDRLSSPETRQRFEREAKTISQLSHPHICALYDVGREGEIEYLVMELLEGETLAARLSRGPLAPEQTLRFGIEIAHALDKAHRQGIVHRDLKPGNVMLTKSGVKLLDFGLAKALLSAGGEGVKREGLTSLPTQASPVTQAGTVLGTFQYMSPEQLEGGEADTRSDIFAFGAVLYEMATGRRAFEGQSQASLITAIMSSDPPPISSLQPLSPRELDRVVRRCLAKDRERRWQSARDLGLEIEEILAAPDRHAGPALRRSVPFGWIAAGILLALLVVSLWLPRRGSVPLPLSRLRWTIPPPPASALPGMLALSPDGRSLAFVATGADGNDLLYLRPLDGLETRLLPDTEGASFPFWSSDGRSIGFFARGKLKKVDLAGGSASTLCDAAQPRGGSWSPRGMIVFSVNAGGAIAGVSDNGGAATVFSHVTTREGQSSRWPTFLPDGQHYLYYAFVGDPRHSGIYVASLDSKETTRLTAADGGAIYATPGYLLYRLGDRLVAHRFDAKRRILSGEPFPVVERIRFDGNTTLLTSASASQSGLLACQTGGPIVSRLLWYERNGHELGSVPPDGAFSEPALSTDGRRLAISRGNPESLGGGIWTIDLDRGSIAPVTSRAAFSATALWSADARRIVYSTWPTGEVYVRDAQGAEGEKLLFQSKTFTPLDDWSRDGRFLFYDVIDWQRFHFDVWVRDLSNGVNRPLLQASFDESGARLSADGHWVAYESMESGSQQVFLRSFPESTERRQVSVDGGNQPRWRGDGRELYFASPDRKIMAVEIRTAPRLEVGPPRALFQTRILTVVEARNQYDATADGQRFIVNSRRQEDAMLPITILSGWMPKDPGN